jgi:hypothetical protein
LCHCADSYASLVANILFNLGANGKCRNTFCGIFFLSGSSYLDRPQIGQSSSLAYCFLNITQLLKHTCIELYDLGSVLHSGNASAKSFTIAEKAE